MTECEMKDCEREHDHIIRGYFDIMFICEPCLIQEGKEYIKDRHL